MTTVGEWVPHTDMPKVKKTPEYCPECGMPPDYCEYGGKWEVCKPWVLVNYPEYYPELAGLSLDDAKEAADKKKTEIQSKTKELPGGKKKRSKSPSIIVKVAKRQGKKMTTSVIGLDTFGVSLEDAAKTFKKKFACGSAAVKGTPGEPDHVAIQGDPDRDQLLDLLKGLSKDIVAKKVTYQQKE